ncbi:MAG: hypothetical protein E6G89_15755 [Alphaproteobacteria bacterium]|nr:MAG: hypothetical protein E6G89_15755 [Alphaproteobacteria bacterium]
MLPIDAPNDARHGGDARTAVAIDEGAGDRHGDDGAQGDGQQRQTENAGADIEAVLGERNMRHPGADDGTVHQEGQRDRPARFMDS